MAIVVFEVLNDFTGNVSKELKFNLPPGKYAEIIAVGIDIGPLQVFNVAAGTPSSLVVTLARDSSLPNPNQRGFLMRSSFSTISQAGIGNAEKSIAHVSTTDVSKGSTVSGDSIWANVVDTTLGDSAVYISVEYKEVSLSDLERAVLAWT